MMSPMAISELFSPNLLGPVFGLSEFALLLGKRSGSGATSADRGSLRLLWGVIGLCVVLAILAGNLVPQANSSWLWRLRTAGGVLFLLGLLLRWYAIVTLGRFFTVNVAIAADHRVIDTGPYRLVRRPVLQWIAVAVCGTWDHLWQLAVPGATGVAGAGGVPAPHRHRGAGAQPGTRRPLPPLHGTDAASHTGYLLTSLLLWLAWVSGLSAARTRTMKLSPHRAHCPRLAATVHGIHVPAGGRSGPDRLQHPVRWPVHRGPGLQPPRHNRLQHLLD